MAQETALVATFALNYDVRIIKIGEEFWFVAVDVAKVLGIEKIRNTLADFPEDEKKMINLRSTAHSMGGSSIVSNTYGTHSMYNANGKGGNPNVRCVNEAGLYRLIFISRKPEAENFKRWVFHDVLPQIRKTGSYSIDKKKTLLKDFKPTRTFEDVATVTNILDDNGIKYDYDITAITFEYNEELGRVCQTYNIELKLVD